MTAPERTPGEVDETRSTRDQDRREPADRRDSQTGDGTHRMLPILCASLVAGVAGWGLVEMAWGTFEPEKFAPPPGASAMNPSIDPRSVAADRKAEIQNTVLCLALMGGALGGCLGLAAGLIGPGSRSRSAIVGLLAGSVLGAVCGGLGSYAGSAVHDTMARSVDYSPMFRAYVAQGLAWTILGLGVGAGSGIASLNPKTTAVRAGAGAFAGLLGVLVYQTVASLLLPAEDTAPIIPRETIVRATWAVLSCVVIGLIVAATSTTGTRERSRAPVASAS